jgi:pyruvate/2-oxoglutarate dehydrogenase complex dihydrolipoamide acyltransferase (E2) component
VTDVPFPEVSQKDPEAEGVLATWFVADGDQVAEGNLIAEVAVDKVDMEIPAPAAGTIHLLATEGDVIKQGTIVARIE